MPKIPTAKSLANLELGKFKKGQSGNPEGARAHNPEKRMLRNLTESEMVEIGSLVVKGSIDELKAIKSDGKTPVLKAMMAAVAIKTIQTGNSAALDVLLNRLVGKVKEHVIVNSSNQTELTVSAKDKTKELPDEELRQRILKIRNERV